MMLPRPRITQLRATLQKASGIALLAMLAACASTQSDGLSTRLDEATGVTHTWVTEPLLFVRETPQFGAFSRSFVSVGLIESNRSGNLDYFLRASAWRTDQFSDYSADVSSLETLMIIADGTPVFLEVTGWAAEDVFAGSDIYVRPFAKSPEAFYRLTPLQIGMIAGSTSLELLSGSAGGDRYSIWGDERAAHRRLEQFYSLTQQ